MVLITCFSLLSLPSCQKDEIGLDSLDLEGLEVIAMLEPSPDALIYYEPETFSSVAKQSITVTHELSNSNFEYFANFFLKVEKRKGVSMVEIRIDGNLIVTYSDFAKGVKVVAKPITLIANSILEVKLEGSKGSSIQLLIEGTLKEDVIVDIDGNFYHTVQIDDQWWMAENLKNTNGLAISTPGSSWHLNSIYQTPQCCNNVPYGYLYNFYAVKNNANLCPAGWRIPTKTELEKLLNYLGGADVAGLELKEVGTDHWWAEAYGTTNSTRFTALPGGSLDFYGTEWYPEGGTGVWWTSTESDPTLINFAWYYMMVSGEVKVYVDLQSAELGFSIRCIKQ